MYCTACKTQYLLVEQAAKPRMIVNVSGGHKITGLVKHKNSTLLVWEYFRFCPNDKGELGKIDKAMCDMCLRKVVAEKGNVSKLNSAKKSGSLGPSAKISGRRLFIY